MTKKEVCDEFIEALFPNFSNSASSSYYDRYRRFSLFILSQTKGNVEKAVKLARCYLRKRFLMGAEESDLMLSLIHYSINGYNLSLLQNDRMFLPQWKEMEESLTVEKVSEILKPNDIPWLELQNIANSEDSAKNWDSTLLVYDPIPQNLGNLFSWILGSFRGIISFTTHYWDREGNPVIIFSMPNFSVDHFISTLKKIAPPSFPFAHCFSYLLAYGYELCIRLFENGKNSSKLLNKNNATQEIDNVGVHDISTQKNLSFSTSNNSSNGNISFLDSIPLPGITVIINIDGFSSNVINRDLFSLVKYFFCEYSTFYPDIIRRCCIINCPLLIDLSVKIILPLLPNNLKKKFIFVKKGLPTTNLIKKYIPEEFSVLELIKKMI